MVYPAVLLPQMKIIIHLINLGIHAPGYFVGDTQKNCPVIAVIFKQHVQRKPLQCQERKKDKIPANEKKDVTHWGKVSSFKPQASGKILILVACAL